MERYICIHGHFYQPPRENPWLEAIELQDEAYPYHDWNERISAECYGPNSASRILDAQGRIVQIVNNYARISFNFGPTLLAWLEAFQPAIYAAIQEADRLSADASSGHGSALAQPYNHMIMPLATARDRRTQTVWGIRDFRRRFRRDPEGMWLPETAVDLPTLEVLAEQGIRFTILAPHQAARIRPLGSEAWTDVRGAKIDPSRAYLQRLPSGREIVLFFYDGPVSRAVAFERLLTDGERFARRIAAGFDEQRRWPQLAHIATDGETYGHHHRHGDMALAYALDYLTHEHPADLTSYGAYLARHPPETEVEILESTSWSCAHGIERWRSDCGCVTGGLPGWNQAWRQPLRAALDWLSDALAPSYTARAAELLRDPEAARDDYIDVILDRSEPVIDAFLTQHARNATADGERVQALKLMELQRHLMLMYTSCGWFFNEVSGIETVQVLQYAGRAVQLGREVLGHDLEPEFLARLESARSNLPERDNARQIFMQSVRPAMVDLHKVAAHFAISSLFEPYGEEEPVYCYTVRQLERHVHEAGRARLVLGRLLVRSDITREAADLTFGVLHFGDHNVNAGIRTFQGQEAYEALLAGVRAPFDRADFPTVLRLLDRHFGPSTYSLGSLFWDEQRRILDRLLEVSIAEAEEEYRRMYRNQAALTRFVAGLNIPQPKALRMAAEFVLNTSLRRALQEEIVSLGRVRSLLEEARNAHIPLDVPGLSFVLEETLQRSARRWAEHPESLPHLQRVETLAGLARTLPFDVNLWEVQNTVWDIGRHQLPLMESRAEQAGAEAAEWVARFRSLAETVAVAVA
jgi:hypothetical protein